MFSFEFFEICKTAFLENTSELLFWVFQSQSKSFQDTLLIVCFFQSFLNKYATKNLKIKNFFYWIHSKHLSYLDVAEDIYEGVGPKIEYLFS